MKRRKKRSWKDKVHPAFVEATQIYRESVLAIKKLKDRYHPREVAELHGQAMQKILALKGRYGELPAGPYWVIYSSPPSLPIEEVVKWLPGSVSKGLLEWLCWKRFRRPLWQLALEDAAGMRESSKQIERLISEGNKLRYGEQGLLPGFKFGLDHSALLEIGLPFGLDKLSSEELANCFAEICPCGKSHNADALKKQRKRLVDALGKALAWQENPPLPVAQYLQRKRNEETNT